MQKTFLRATLIAASVLAAACASGGRKDPGLGLRTLDCVVIERQQVAVRGGGDDYTMVFEAREGQATSRYHLEVTKTQWFRFPEGSHVRITLNNNILTDIRSIE